MVHIKCWIWLQNSLDLHMVIDFLYIAMENGSGAKQGKAGERGT